MDEAVAVWNLLHDGVIVDVEGTRHGDLSVTVEIQYLRAMLPEPGDSLRLQLCDVDLRAEEPEILSAARDGGHLVLSVAGRASGFHQLRMRPAGIGSGFGR